jgi:hypothetical protein
MASMYNCLTYLAEAPQDDFVFRRGSSDVLSVIKYLYANPTSYEYDYGLAFR